MRCLRSKRLRAALWHDANGKCEICGDPLPDDWHADHTIPYVVSGRTNVHEMKATCPKCNRRKGAMGTRKHQGETIELFKAVGGEFIPLPKFLNIDCICGGGKSIIPVIVAYYMIRKLKLADKVVWTVPQTSLMRQGAQAFLKGEIADKLLDHGLKIAENDNTPNPCKGTDGYIANMAAIIANPDLHRQFFEKHRTILITDEFHHVRKESAFARAMQTLQSRAVLTVPMSGYWGRHDGVQLDFMRYSDSGMLDMSEDTEHRWVHYNLEDAFREKAIIPVHFVQCDSAAKFEMLESKIPIEVKSLGLNRDAIFAALHSEFACELMDKCYKHWKIYKKHRKRSKLLVVCANTRQAGMILKYIKEVLHEENVAIATYNEDKPNITIDNFREHDEIQVLVTVAKAYEGLDVKRITHLAILTHIRSEGWILQNIARAWRFDSHPDAGPWEGQVAHVFLPDDDLMKKCIRWIKDIQLRLAVDPTDDGNPRGGDGDGPGKGPDHDYVLPLTSALTTERSSGLHGEAPVEDAMRVRLCNDIIAGHSLPISLIECQSMIEEILDKAKHSPDVYHAPPRPDEEDWGGLPWTPEYPAKPGDRMAPPVVLPELTDTDKRKRLKNHIVNHVNTFANGDDVTIKAMNTELLIRFGPRNACTESGLREALAYLQSRYPRKNDA